MTSDSSTFAAFWRGTWDSLPATLGASTFGLAFGVLAAQTGLPLWMALALSILLFSGAAQFVVLQAWSDPLSILAVTGGVAATNARFLLLSAVLYDRWRGVPAALAYPALYLLVDTNWALAMRQDLSPRAHLAYFVGAAVPTWFGWLAVTYIGHTAGQAIDNPAAFGLTVALPSFFLASAFRLWRGLVSFAPLVLAIAVSVAMTWTWPGPWVAPIAIVTGALIALVVPARNA